MLVDAVPGDDERDTTIKRFPTWGDAADLIDVLDVQPGRRPAATSSAARERLAATGRRGQPDARPGDRGRRPPRPGPAGRVGVDGVHPGRRRRAARTPSSSTRSSDGRTFTALGVRADQGGRTCAAGTAAARRDRARRDPPRRSPLRDVPGPVRRRPPTTCRSPAATSASSTTPTPATPTRRSARRCSTRGSGSATSPTTSRSTPALLAQFTGHMSIAAALRPHAGHRPGPGPPHALDGDQRHLAVAPRRRPGRPVDAVPPPVDVRRRRHDPRRVPGATTRTGALVASFTVDAMVRAFADPAPAATTGRRCEPHHRRAVRSGRTRPAGSRRRCPPGVGVRRAPPPAGRRPCSTAATVIDTERALMVHRAGQPLDLRLPAPTRSATCRTSPSPRPPGYVRVPWDAVDAWFEEGRQLVHYPPNPYHRVDCRPDQPPPAGRGRRHHAGRHRRHHHPVRDRRSPRSSTSHPSRVRTDLLRRTDTTTYCNYKG